MRIGDDKLFEIGCRTRLLHPVFIDRNRNLSTGVESPTVGDFNTVSTRTRVHHTVRIASYCVIGVGCLVVPTDDEFLDDYTVIYGPAAERRTWSGRARYRRPTCGESTQSTSGRCYPSSTGCDAAKGSNRVFFLPHVHIIYIVSNSGY